MARIELLGRHGRVVIRRLHHLRSGGHAHGFAVQETHRSTLVLNRRSLPAEQIVQHHLFTILRNRERQTADGTTHQPSPPTRLQRGARRVLESVVVHPLRRSGRASGGLHLQIERVRGLPHHFLYSLGPLFPILGHVFGIDGEQRFVFAKGVGYTAV